MDTTPTRHSPNAVLILLQQFVWGLLDLDQFTSETYGKWQLKCLWILYGSVIALPIITIFLLEQDGEPLTSKPFN